jgi:hypothetical protein
MMRACYFGGGAIDDDEDVTYFIFVLFDHLVESTVDAFQLIEGDVLLGTCLGVGQVCDDIYFLSLNQDIFGNLFEVSTQNRPLSLTELINLVCRLHSFHCLLLRGGIRHGFLELFHIVDGIVDCLEANITAY